MPVDLQARTGQSPARRSLRLCESPNDRECNHGVLVQVPRRDQLFGGEPGRFAVCLAGDRLGDLDRTVAVVVVGFEKR